MLFWQKPTAAAIQHFLTAEAKLPFSYSAVGATAATPPKGFVADRTRVQLGEGEQVFEAARHALQRWEQFRLGWVEPCSTVAPIRPGEVVGVLARSLGLWWLNSCRIVYVVDEFAPLRKFGFAYGTLPGHVERGEERFLIEWDPRKNSVWYDILAFSRPNAYLARLGYPFVRRKQKQFGRESAAALLRGVRAADALHV